MSKKNMKTLACKDLADGSMCPFVAEGMSDEEVMGKTKAHMMAEHKADYDAMMSKMSEDEMTGMMKSKMKEV